MAADENGGSEGLQIRVAVPADCEMIAAHNCAMACETEERVLDCETARKGALGCSGRSCKGVVPDR